VSGRLEIRKHPHGSFGNCLQGSCASMNMQAIDPKRFRSVMGTFPTGVAVITTAWNGALFGATINSLTSVSLKPSMLLFCTSEGSETAAAIRPRGVFSVNILGQHQYDLSASFTGKSKQKNRFEDLAIAFSADGLPLLQGAAAQLCCRVAAMHRAGARHHSGRSPFRRRDRLQSARLSQGRVWKLSTRLIRQPQKSWMAPRRSRLSSLWARQRGAPS
jgi:3-hydroxy-9,10-secoandrosta-1,3,5(10)-triene-9,17-dione monooxygenase reductase component